MPRKKKMDVAPGGPYGQQAELSRAQDAVPAGPAVTDPLPFVGPGDVPNLNDPTNRPDEPITAGMPFGPGPGPREPVMQQEDPALARLRQLYGAYPSPHIRRMIQRLGG
jgi:hypothetical protein